MKIHKLFYCFIVFLLLVSSGYGAIDDTGEKKEIDINNLTQLSLEELMDIQVATVYGASKYEQKVTEAPSSISIITADEISKYGYRTLADILRSQRSFYITYDRNYSYAGARGFGRPGDYNARILVMVDGHKMNDNVCNGVLIGTEFIVDVDLIDHVEIIRGPSSSLYGSNAFFGVINIITRHGRDLHGVEGSGSAASFDSYTGRLSYGSAFQGGPEILFSGSAYDSKGQDLFFEEFNDESTNNGWARNSDYDRTKSFFAKALFRDFNLTGAYVSRKKGLPAATYATVFNNADIFTNDESGYLDLKYEHRFQNFADVVARVNYNFNNYHGDYIYNWADPGDPQELVVNKDFSNGRWLGAGLQINKMLFEKHMAVFGIDYEHNLRQDQGNYDKTVYLDDRRRSSVWAVFAQDEFHIFSNLILNAGLRHDHYETFGGTTNPRLAFIYSPFEKTTVKLLYGTAFRAPNLYELYYEDAGISTKSNPSLKPEEIQTYEIVLEKYLWGSIRMTASGFYYRIKGLISQEFDPSDDLMIYKNLGNIDSKGGELEFEEKWENGVSGRISYSYQDTKDQDIKISLSNSPKHLAKLNVIIPIVKQSIFAGTEVQYMSRRKTILDGNTQDFLIANLTLFSQDLIKGLNASLSVYNLFNKKYEDPVGREFQDPDWPEHTRDAIEQDGASLRMKVMYKY